MPEVLSVTVSLQTESASLRLVNTARVAALSNLHPNPNPNPNPNADPDPDPNPEPSPEPEPIALALTSLALRTTIPTSVGV